MQKKYPDQSFGVSRFVFASLLLLAYLIWLISTALRFSDAHFYFFPELSGSITGETITMTMADHALDADIALKNNRFFSIMLIGVFLSAWKRDIDRSITRSRVTKCGIAAICAYYAAVAYVVIKAIPVSTFFRLFHFMLYDIVIWLILLQLFLSRRKTDRPTAAQ